MQFFYYTKFPAFNLKISTINNQIIAVDFLLKDIIIDSIKVESMPFFKNVTKQLDQYLANPGHKFDVPLLVKGTDFQKRVWDLMLRIKPGSPISYGAAAKELATSPRAIGKACGSNHLPIFIPCHRIIASNNKLCGFVKSNDKRYLAMKKWLIEHELKA